MLRKINRGGVILATLLALAGCQSEKLVDDSSSQGCQVTLTASRGVSSRTNFGADGSKLQLRWSADDKIYVSSKDGKTTGVLTLSSKPDEATGTFTGFVFGNPKDLYYSVYPVPENGKIELTEVVGNEYKIPMVGRIDPINNEVPFETNCGIGYMDEDDSEEALNMELSAGTDESNLVSLACVAEIDYEKLQNEGVISLKYSPHPQKKSIKLAEVEPVNGVYVIPFDLQNNANKQVKLYKSVDGGTPEVISDKTITLPASTSTQAFDTGISISVYEGGDIKVTEEIVVNNGTAEVPATKPVVEIPKVEENLSIQLPITLQGEEGEEEVVSKAVVSIGEISNPNATIRIESADRNNESQIEKLTVVLPSGTTQEQVAEQVVINMPNTTVTVKSEDGNVLNIDNVVALTGDNTFIIKEGVVIENLIAMKGAIEVSGNVKAITRGEGHHYGNNKVKVFVKNGGKIPSDINKNEFEVEYEVDDPVVDKPEEPEILEEYRATNVLGFEAFMNALNKNAKHTYIELGDGMAIEAPIVIEEGRQVEINLNGKYMVLIEQFFERYNPEAVIVNNGHLTITNGTINGHSEGTLVDNYLIKSVNDELMLRLVNVQCHQIKNGIYVKDGAFFLNENSSITAEGYAMYLEANDFCDTDIWTGKVNGNVYWALNNSSYSDCRFGVGPSSIVNGNLTIGGNYGVKATGYHLVKEATAKVNGQGWNFNEFVGDNQNPPVSETDHYIANFTELQKVVESMQPVFDNYGQELQHNILYTGTEPLVVTEPVTFRHSVHLSLEGKKVIVDMNNSTNEIMAVFETTDKSLRITNGTLECPADQTNIVHFIYARNFQENNYCEVVLHNVKMELGAVMNAIFAQNMFVKITDTGNVSSIITPLNGESSSERGRVLDISYTDLYKEKQMLEISIPGTLQGDFYIDAQHLNEGDATKYFKFENGQIVGNLSAAEYLFDNFYMLDTVTTNGSVWEYINKVKTPNTGGQDFEKGGIW